MNDASALVLLRTSLAALLGTFSFWQAVGDFAVAVLVALAVGGIVAGVTIVVRARISDPVLTTTISFFVPFLAYFPTEELHGSGVLATVVAGVITGHRAARRFSAAARSTEAANWSTISFVLESAVFLVMGLQLPGLVEDARKESGLDEVLLISLTVFGLLVVLRAVGVLAPVLWRRWCHPVERNRQRLEQNQSKLESFTASSERQEQRVQNMRRWIDRGRADLAFEANEPIGRKGAIVLTWSGMRGVVTLAAAQTIPAGTEHRALVVLIAFVIAVATLVGFGSTLPLVIRRLNFTDASMKDRWDEISSLLRAMVDTVSEELGPLQDQQIDGAPIAPAVIERMEKVFAPLLKGAIPPEQTRPGDRDQMIELQRRYVDALREALLDERSIGSYRSETYLKVQSVLDALERRTEQPG